MCSKRKRTGEMVVLDFMGLVVTDVSTTVHRGERVDLPCFGALIKAIFPPTIMRQVWYRGKEEIESREFRWASVLVNKSNINADLESRSVNYLHIPKVSRGQEGDYRCVLIEITNTRRNWTLNQLKLVVTNEKLLIDHIGDENVKTYLKIAVAVLAACVTVNLFINIVIKFCIDKNKNVILE